MKTFENSPQELKAIEMAEKSYWKDSYNYPEEIEKWLSIAKKVKRNNENVIGYILYCMKKEGLTYAQAGITREEIDKLYILGYLAEAQKSLQNAENSKRDNTEFLIRMEEFLTKAGATCLDIGATRQEINELYNRGYINEASFFKEIAVMYPRANEFSFAKMNIFLSLAGKKHTDIDLSDKQYAYIRDA